jgi:hypothetical protein
MTMGSNATAKRLAVISRRAAMQYAFAAAW